MNTEALHRKDRERFEQRRKEHGERPSSLRELVNNGEWRRLRENDEFNAMGIEGQVLMARKAVEVRIKQIEPVFYEQLNVDRLGARNILHNRINPLKNLNKALGRILGDEASEEKKGDVAEILALPLAGESHNI